MKYKIHNWIYDIDVLKLKQIEDRLNKDETVFNEIILTFMEDYAVMILKRDDEVLINLDSKKGNSDKDKYEKTNYDERFSNHCIIILNEFLMIINTQDVKKLRNLIKILKQ